MSNHGKKSSPIFQYHHNIIGLFPAGGRASRIAPLPCSKEIYPVGMHHQSDKKSIRPKVAGHYLLEKMRIAGAKKAYVILGQGKWDIPSYFSNGKFLDMSIAYLVVETSYGVPFTLDQAYPFVKDAMVVFGFPDILFQPDEAFIQLIERQAETGADLVLGLFPASQPNKVDMVELDRSGRIIGLSIKPLETQLHYSWIIAVWTPLFTKFIHDFVQNFNKNNQNTQTVNEVFLGDVIKSAIQHEITIEKVIFDHATFLDIGTPEDLAQVIKVFG
jgi:glucose-1-phosphate thymidylyltransferase